MKIATTTVTPLRHSTMTVRLNHDAESVDQALIVGGVAVAGDVTAIVVALLTTQRRARADAERLAAEHLEADRLVRRDAYQQMMTAVQRLDTMASVYAAHHVSKEAFDDWLQSFRLAEVQVHLVESPAVKRTAIEVAGIFHGMHLEVSARLASGMTMAQALDAPYRAIQLHLQAAAISMADAMREDLAFGKSSDSG